MLMARYDRTAALIDGKVPVAGLDLAVTEVNDDPARQRLGLSGAYDVWEGYAGRYLMDLEAGRREFVAIPVFPKRSFRHSSIYVRRAGTIRSPGELQGRRVAVQHWGTTAAIWAKGILADDYGLDLRSVDWVQTSPDEPAWVRPSWLRLEQGPSGRTPSDLLLNGEVDAAISASALAPYEHPELGYLFPDYRSRERDYFARTRIFPIMHLLLVRSSILDEDPSIALRLLEAWTAAKLVCLAAMERDRQLVSSMWFRGLFEEERAAVGSPDTYPWGFRQGRHEIAKLVEYAVDQGVLTAQHEPEELFHPATLDS